MLVGVRELLNEKQWVLDPPMGSRRPMERLELLECAPRWPAHVREHLCLPKLALRFEDREVEISTAAPISCLSFAELADPKGPGDVIERRKRFVSDASNLDAQHGRGLFEDPRARHPPSRVAVESNIDGVRVLGEKPVDVCAEYVELPY